MIKGNFPNKFRLYTTAAGATPIPGFYETKKKNSKQKSFPTYSKASSRLALVSEYADVFTVIASLRLPMLPESPMHRKQLKLLPFSTFFAAVNSVDSAIRPKQTRIVSFTQYLYCSVVFANPATQASWPIRDKSSKRSSWLISHVT